MRVVSSVLVVSVAMACMGIVMRGASEMQGAQAVETHPGAAVQDRSEQPQADSQSGRSEVDSASTKATPPADQTTSEKTAADESHQHGPGRGFGPGAGGGRGRGFGRGAGFGAGGGNREDMMAIHGLFDARDKITRIVKNLPNGAESITESKDDLIAGLIQEHVPAMEARVNKNNPLPPMTFHPLFIELIKHADAVEFKYETTEHGIKVRYTSEDPYVVTLIQEHAQLVSRFIKNGMDEIHKPYTIPGQKPAATSDEPHGQASETAVRHPVIEGHGAVVRLPDAADQPRDGSKICVDLTAGGAPDKLNPGIAKLARYVNIYSQAGKVPATVHIYVILHGDATLVSLNDEAYAKRFGTDANPNLPLIRQLHEAGVELLVCGQALASKQADSQEVTSAVTVAVSGLTVNVNRQQDGYAFIPLH